MVWFSVLLVVMSVYAPFSNSMCRDGIMFGKVAEQPPFWERDAHSAS